MKTIENNTQETAAGPEFKQTPFIALVPFLPDQTYNGVVKNARVDIDHKGRNVTIVKIDSEAGPRTKTYMSHTPGTCAYVLGQLKQAFGIESFEQIDQLVGKPCTFSSHTNDYNGKTEIEYINRHNEHAGEKANLAAMTEMAKAHEATKEAELVHVKDVLF